MENNRNYNSEGDIKGSKDFDQKLEEISPAFPVANLNKPDSNA